MASAKTVPLIFLNLGGEMMYILDQRLNAQRIPKDKAMKVMNEIVSVMLNERFLNELFKLQEVYNKPALKKLFEDLAHASIMRLNDASMDKLYDLMVMAFKYQIFMAQRPLDLILVTLNHLDAFRSFVSPAIHKQVDTTYMMVMNTYAHLSMGELQTIRYSILNFLQDLRVRVSVFLRQKVQNPDGHFVISTSGSVPPGCEVPGFIRLFDSNGDVRAVKHFCSGGDFTAANSPGSMELQGDRGTHLGCNIYSSLYSGSIDNISYPAQTRSNLNVVNSETGFLDGTGATEDCHTNQLQVGREELNLLLAQLLGHTDKDNPKSAPKDLIRLNLFASDEEEEKSGQHQETSFNNFIEIDARTQCRSSALEKIYGEMTVESSSVAEDKNDLLDLLDSC